MYLVVESRDGGMHSYRHPDPQMRGELDITVKPGETLVQEVTEGFSWMRVPWFINGIKGLKPGLTLLGSHRKKISRPAFISIGLLPLRQQIPVKLPI